jgi:hypothetical protein
MCLVAVPAGASQAPGTGSPDDSTDGIDTEEVVVSFSGELTPLQFDEEGGGEVSTFGSLTLDGECRVTAGALTADGVVLDDAVSLEGSTAVTLATGEPTLFVNALGGSDVATVRADPDGAISGTARVSDGEVEKAFYRVRGSWTSSDVLPACIVADSGLPRPVVPDPEPGEAAGPAQPRITGIVPGPAGSGAVSVVFEAGDDWAPASEAALTGTAVLGVQYRVDNGRWQPAQVPSGRGGTFSVWGLPERAESRIEVRTVGSEGYSEPSEAVAVTPAAEDSVSEDLELVRSDCADVPLPTTTIESVEVSPSLEVAVTYSLAAGGGNDLDAESACMASLEWSVAGDGVPDPLRHQTLELPEGSDAPEDTFTFSAFGLPAGTWTVTVDATSKGDPYAESTAAEPFEVGSGPPPTPSTQDCESSAPSVPSLTAPEKNPDGSYTVGFALSAPDGAAAGDCTTRVSAWVPSADLADTPVELDGAGGSFTVSGDLSPGVHEVSIATANAADPRFTRAVGSALLAVPAPGSVESLEVSYGQERFAFATGANVGIQPPAVLGADDPAFAALADLPVGLFLDPQTGAVFGTAVRPTDGPLSVPIRVTDDDGSSATTEVHLEVADPGEDSGLVGYPEGIWAPEGEVIAVTPMVDGGVAGTISNSDSAIPVEPFSGTVLWRIPPAAGATPATSTTAEAAATGNTDATDEEGDPLDPGPQAEGAEGEVETAVMYGTTEPESPGEATLTATAFDPAAPVPFEAAPDGSCDHRGPDLYRSRELLAGSSVGLLPKLPASSEPTRFEVTDGALPPGITLDASSGALLGSPEGDGDFGFSMATEFSNSTRRTAQVTLAVEASSESVSYPAVMHTVSGDSFEAVPQISGEEVEELLSLVCGTLPRGLAFDDRSGAVEGIVGASGAESEPGADNGTEDGIGPGTRDPNAPVSIVVASDIESEVVTASMVLSASPEPLPQLGYPAEMGLLTGEPVELSPSLAAMPDEAEFKVSNGALPPGLRLRPDTGEVVGSAVRGSDPTMVTISATDDEGELVAAATATLTVEDHTEEGSRWWWLWFVAGAVAMAATAAAELGRRARAPREAEQG